MATLKLNVLPNDITFKLIGAYLRSGLTSLEISSSNDKTFLKTAQNEELQDRFRIAEHLAVLAQSQDQSQKKFYNENDSSLVKANFDQMLRLVLETPKEQLIQKILPFLTSKYLMGKEFTIIDVAAFAPACESLLQKPKEEIHSVSSVLKWLKLVVTNLKGSIQEAGISDLTKKLEELQLKKPEKAKKPTKNTPDPLVITPKLIDLRVGKILECKKHEQADSLYVEQIDLGEEQPRTIVSGLVNHISLQEMQNRLVVVVCNLKPVSMRGIKSCGMVLAATSKEGKVELVEPPENSTPGDLVYVEGYKNEEKRFDQLNPKKKIWETIQPGLKTNCNLQATYVDEKENKEFSLKTDNGVCTVQSVVEANIK